MGLIVRAILDMLKGIPEKKGEPRADMFLPRYILLFGAVLALGAVGCLVAFAFILHIGFIVAAAACAILSVLAFMCWSNQKIIILDDDRFQYITFTGTKKTYRFSEIKSLRRNNDSLTLFVGNGKVHIESAAILSERLIKKINEALEKNS